VREGESRPSDFYFFAVVILPRETKRSCGRIESDCAVAWLCEDYFLRDFRWWG